MARELWRIKWCIDLYARYTVNGSNSGCHRTSQTICANTAPAAFTSTTDATSSCYISYQWQSSPDNITWSDIRGRYTGNLYLRQHCSKNLFPQKCNQRLCCNGHSNTIFVDIYATITSGSVSADQSFCKGTTAALLTSTVCHQVVMVRMLINGNRPLIISDGQILAGATATTYSPGVAPVTTYYRRKCYVLCSYRSRHYSNFITISVTDIPTITTQPANPTSCTNGSTSSVWAATGAGLTYQWQVNTGSGFTNVTNVAPYSGATSATLLINPVPISHEWIYL